MDEGTTSLEPTTGGKVSKAGTYAKVAVHIDEILEGLFELTKPTHNENVRLGALRTLLNKVLPDLQAVKHEGDVTITGVVIYKPEKNKE